MIKLAHYHRMLIVRERHAGRMLLSNYAGWIDQWRAVVADMSAFSGAIGKVFGVAGA